MLSRNHHALSDTLMAHRGDSVAVLCRWGEEDPGNWRVGVSRGRAGSGHGRGRAEQPLPGAAFLPSPAGPASRHRPARTRHPPAARLPPLRPSSSSRRRVRVPLSRRAFAPGPRPGAAFRRSDPHAETFARVSVELASPRRREQPRGGHRSRSGELPSPSSAVPCGPCPAVRPPRPAPAGTRRRTVLPASCIQPSGFSSSSPNSIPFMDVPRLVNPPPADKHWFVDNFGFVCLFTCLYVPGGNT